MSCNDIASILDSHRSAGLAPAERAAVDEHLSACEDCAAAWHAHGELVALRVPPMPAALLERALLASRMPQPARARRARGPLVVGSALLAGAALAGVTIVSLTRSASEPTVQAIDGAPSAAQSAAPRDELATRAETAAATPQDERATSVELVETGLDVLPLVRHNPAYPPEALAQGVDGHVQLEFDITPAGTVENVRVVESSDARFEESAVEALSQWRYLPRIVAGKRVGSNDVKTIIRFQLVPDGAAPGPTDREIEAALRDFAAFSAGLEVALDRLAADDFRGAELQLDEMIAVYGAARLDVWNFYGYLYTVQGHYDRAIGAYETAVDLATRSKVPTSGPFVQLANLYFARHQYDLAMKTLLRPNLPGGNRVMSPAATALIQKLNALGITEETVP
jgi:TonB family protein